MSVAPTKSMKKRMYGFIIPVFIVFIFWIIGHMVKYSIMDAESLQKMANQKQFGSITIHANRGSIYDRNGNILAQSATVYNIIMDPAGYRDDVENGKCDKKTLNLLAGKMKELMGVDPADIFEKSEVSGAGEKYQVLKKKVEKPVADELLKYCDEIGVGNWITTEPDTKRFYAYGDLAASVIGFLDGDGAGQYGLEAYYDDYLAGIDGRIISARDGKQREMPYRYKKTYDAQDGNSLVLTIDTTLQHYLEKNLQEQVSQYEAKNRACGIIMNAKTGAILAMATVPGFDLNNPAEIYDEETKAYLDTLSGDEYKKAYINAREKQWKNKAITEIYYPGSVFKVITGSAALEEKVIDLNTQYSCHTMTYPGMKSGFHCWTTKGHGTQNFFDALANSCNPAFIQIGEKLGIEKFYSYFENYGLTEKTGVDLPGEVNSLHVWPKYMGPVELASSAFGQTNKITPIQMITSYAAVINGGKLVTPYIVDRIEDNKGNIIKQNEPVIKRQVISEETSKQMREALEYVVDFKGSSNAYIEGYRIGGKSGTSQKQDENNEQNRDDLYVSSYCAFAPADDPEIIMLVMVDEPSTGEYYGSVVAVPAVRNTFVEALPYLGYYKEYTEDQLAELDIKVPSLEGQTLEEAKQTLGNIGLTYDIVGAEKENDTEVVGQVPELGKAISRGGKVILYTDTDYKEEYVEVPNLLNKTLAEVNAAIADKSLNLKITGPSKREGATAVMQNWQEGAVVPKGTIVEVIFAVHDQTG